MKNLVKYVQNVNALHKLWTENDTVVIGVSGGPDSMCLLDVMVHIAKIKNINIVVAHVNYGLRGESSDADQVLVEVAAKKYGLPVEIEQCSEKCPQNENAWRTVRYDFFEEVRLKHGAQSIAVAHTKNDQAETVLLHVLRGSGLNGLSAMQIKNEKKVIRPLLGVDRADILAYCSENDIAYNIDETNEKNEFTRNKIRNHLIPALQKEYNTQIIDVLARLGDTVADDYAFIEGSVGVFWEERGENAVIFSAEYFNTLHIALQRTALRKMISQLSGGSQDIEKGFVEEMRKAIASTKSKNQKILGKDLKITRKGDTVELAY